MNDRELLLTVLMRDINNALGELPAGQRAVLLLVTLEDMTYDAVLGAVRLRVVN